MRWRADHFFLRPNLEMSGSRMLFLALRVSGRPASVEARSTKICAVLPFGSISAIICPLLAAAPNSFASCGMIAVGSVSTALAKSAAAISGRLSMPTPFRTSRDGASLRRAPFTLSIRFLVLRRFARSGLATTITSSAETRIRRAQPDHTCGTSTTIQGVEARIASSSESNEVEDPIKRGWRRQQTEFLAALGEQTLDQHGVDAIRGEHRLRNALRRILIVVESRCSKRKIEIGDDRRHFRNRGQAPCQIVGDGGRSDSTLGANDRDHAPKR